MKIYTMVSDKAVLTVLKRLSDANRLSAPMTCPLRARPTGQCREPPVTHGYLHTPADLRMDRSQHRRLRPPKQKVRPYSASHEILTARNAGCPKTALPPDSLDRVPGRQCHVLVRVMAKRQDVQVAPTPKW
jgi:hypothetical protein